MSLPDDGEIMWRIGPPAPADAVFVDADDEVEIVSVDE